MNTYYVVRSSCPAGFFSFGLLDGLRKSRYEETAGSPSRRRAQTWRSLFIAPCALREAPAGFRLERLAPAFMNNTG